MNCDEQKIRVKRSMAALVQVQPLHRHTERANQIGCRMSLGPSHSKLRADPYNTVIAVTSVVPLVRGEEAKRKKLRCCVLNFCNNCCLWDLVFGESLQSFKNLLWIVFGFGT